MVNRKLLPLLVWPGFSALILLTSCASPVASTTPTPGAAGLRGTVFGGNQPVTQSTIQLFTAGNSGDGSAATLLTTPVATDNNGSFNLSTPYKCPMSNPEVYITATGGNPGLASGTNNSALALMAALGPCNTVTSATVIDINEVTTVAAVFSLAPFMTSYSAVGSGTTDNAALVAAFATVQQLVNNATGVAPGPALPAGAIAPTAKMYTLADALATCINSAGGTAGDKTPCGNLFYYTGLIAGSAPTDTVGAALDLALKPGSYTSLYSQVPPGGPFQPTLTAAPSTWALVIPTLQSIAVTPATAAVNIGSTVQIKAIGTYSDGTQQDASPSMTWSSSNPAQAAVGTSSGLVTGLSAGGPDTIQAALGGLSGTSSVTVGSAILQSITIAPASPGVYVGSSLQLTANGHFSDGSTSALPTAVWISSNTQVATFNTSPAGSANGVAAGTSTVTATVAAVSGSTLLTVSTPVSIPLPTLTSFQVVDCPTFTALIPNCLFSWTAINLHAGDTYTLTDGPANTVGTVVNFTFTATGPTFDNTGSPVTPTAVGPAGQACGTPNNVNCGFLYYDSPDHITFTFTDFGGVNTDYPPLAFYWPQ